MIDGDELLQWLLQQPTTRPLTIDETSITLRVQPDGAALEVGIGALVDAEYLQQFMRRGFSSAIDFDAGIGVTTDERLLLLNQWLPGVSNWAQARVPLEKLINQSAYWQNEQKSSDTKKYVMNNNIERLEHRLRRLLTGANL